MHHHLVLSGVPVLLLAALAAGAQPIHVPSDPDLSPDGSRLAFSWNGDIWIASSKGGNARALTSSKARDKQPKFSPDGKRIAFISDRTGADQVYLLPARGGTPEQITFHTEGCDLEQWSPDGESLLIHAARDHFWKHPERFFFIPPKARPKETLLFDGYGSDGSLSPDGTRLLFVREGVRWTRKGYQGSQASQIWEYSLKKHTFQGVLSHSAGVQSPFWHPDGKGFYFVFGKGGTKNLWFVDFKTKTERQLTHFSDDYVVTPTISKDASVIVFRNGFDFYRLETKPNRSPQRIRLHYNGDERRPPILRRTLDDADAVAFSADGLEVVFAAGGDLWVMDTVLREPKQITRTPEEEREPVFAPDGKSVLFVSDAGGEVDIWVANRKDENRYWWQNDTFETKKLTDDPAQEFNLDWSPDGKRVAFLKGNGDLWLMDPNGENAKKLFASWNAISYTWSPDGKWIVYSLSDSDFNRDIYLLPIDGSRDPFNLSQHPDNDYGPVWSPDGKMIAFTGRHIGDETDIYFVMLQKKDDEVNARDRKLKEAIEKIKKARAPKVAPKPKPVPPSNKPATKPDPNAASKPTAEPANKPDPKPASTPSPDKPTPEKAPPENKTTPKEQKPEAKPSMVIDFEGIHDRIRHVSIQNAREGNLFWSHDSKKLAFEATINGKTGLYTIAPPNDLTPRLLSSSTGSQARWISQGNQIVWLSGGKPARLAADGKSTPYSFSAYQAVEVGKRYEAAFIACWREMRDTFYDANLNNLNWDAIRRKYAPMACDAVDDTALATTINMMLGELNGSHMGFMMRSRRDRDADSWREETAHIGARFDAKYKGPGLKIRDTIYQGPAEEEASRLYAGEVILAIDGVEVDPEMELTSLLNGIPSRDILLKVRDRKGATREVTLRPTSYASVRSKLYEQWIRQNQAVVKKLSNDKLGYVHIQGMNMTSFYRFEEELYSVGVGKDGLIIDVRENGGGSTTDHLLTILTQPAHAFTVPRGGDIGYPHDRKIYATWNKPIVVLCNQNSFSNAEIFTHAIKTLHRGHVVGVPTSGSVISTGGSRIMDMGLLRKPFRGWFLIKDGRDMELNGATPDHVLWPKPCQIPAGKDVQLEKAIQVLTADVATWKKRPRAKPITASELRKEAAEAKKP